MLHLSGPARRLVAEGLGTAILVAAVVGSGIAATRLTSDVGLQLVINAVATVAALGALICVLAPVSGAHLNPAVSLVAAARRELSPRMSVGYVLVQLAGAVVGVALADLMFGLPAWDPSAQERSGLGQLLGEVVATAGLLLVLGLVVRSGRASLAAAVAPAWIGAAYFFTASTSFANPAVTVGRSLTDTFSGIAPVGVLPFVLAQLVGAGLGALAVDALSPVPATHAPARSR